MRVTKDERYESQDRLRMSGSYKMDSISVRHVPNECEMCHMRA